MSINLPKFTQITEAIEYHGFKWDFKNVKLSTLKTGAEGSVRLQVRSLKDVAPLKRINDYAIKLPHTVFPPIVVTKDGFIVDGNTRVAANLKIGRSQVEAVVIDVEFSTAGEKVIKKLGILGALFNADNGQDLDQAAILAHARDAVSLGYVDDVVMQFGCNKNAISKLRKELGAQKALDAFGVKAELVDVTDGKPLVWHIDGKPANTAAFQVLGEQKPLSLNKEPYLALANLICDNKWTSQIAKAVAAEVYTAKSDEEKMAVISSAAQAHKPNPGGYKRTPAVTLKMQLSGVVKTWSGVERTISDDQNADDNLKALLASAATVIGKLNKALGG